ncbi:MAG TPA: tetratricopeptide repeat protein [Armatimonadota bacterium]|jgi:hypothetical protein
MESGSNTFQRGIEALKAGRAQEAVALLQETAEATPTDPKAREMYGIALSMAGDSQRALGELEAAAALSPESASVHYNLGMVYERLGRSDEAGAAYKASLDADPGYKQAQDRLSKLAGAPAAGPSKITLQEVDDLPSASAPMAGVQDLTTPGTPPTRPRPGDLSDGGAPERGRCPQCGEPVLPTDPQCFACGASLATARPTPRPSPVPPQPGPGFTPAPSAEPSRSPLGPILAFLLVLIVAGGGAGWWFVLRSTPSKTVMDLYAAQIAKDKTKFRALLTQESASVFPDQLLDAMTKAVDSAKPEDKKKPVVKSETIEGDTATVTLEKPLSSSGLMMGGGGGDPELVMAKEKGKWKLDLIGTAVKSMDAMPEQQKAMMKTMGPAMAARMGPMGPFIKKVMERMGN